MSSKNSLVFVVPGDEPRQIQNSPQLERLNPFGKIIIYDDTPTTLEQQLTRVLDAHIIINTGFLIAWPREALESLPKLRMMTTSGAGTDHIDVEAASRLGIVVSNQPGQTAVVVAEHIIGLLFAVAKRVGFHTAEIKANRWQMIQNVTLRGKTLGIIGTGFVGREVAKQAKAIGMHIVAWSFHPDLEWAESLGIRYLELEDLLKQSTAVSLHVRLSDQTVGMIGKTELALMRNGSLVINASRGGVIDTFALANALNSGHIMGAGLDVYDPEPPPSGHSILSCDNVIFTPHHANQTPEGIQLINEGAVSNVLAFLNGRPRNLVT